MYRCLLTYRSTRRSENQGGAIREANSQHTEDVRELCNEQIRLYAVSVSV